MYGLSFFFVWKSKKSKNYLIPSTRVLFLLLYSGFEKILIILELRFLNASVLGYISCLIIRRYGSYYVNKLSNISKDYPGLETFLKDGGLTVEAQSNHSIRTATDQSGEQTNNKGARTAG